jgi:hypothetical protein
MNTVKLECFAGISGDMLLGALVDAGVPAELLRDAAASLGIGAELRVRSVQRNGVRATKVDVLEDGQIAEDAPHDHEHGHQPHDHEHGHQHDDPAAHGHHEHSGEHAHLHSYGRNWPEIRALIARAAIPEPAKVIAQRAFALLAEAEGKVHGVSPEQVHFHEVGAVDTIADIVCTAVGAAWLSDERGVTEWRCSAVNVGSGFVNCAHGRMPVPAPATAELLRGVPTYSAGPAVEMTTPTGAALLRALECKFEGGQPFAAETTGYGAGSRDPEGFANVLRLSVGSAVPVGKEKRGFSADRVVVLECAVDDATPQVLAHAMELVLEQGALDAMAAPVTMKKGRLGTLLTVLCHPEKESNLTRLLFRETTTLGIRRREEERSILAREFVTVETAYGRIRVKIASAGGEILNAMPEYEDCRRAAREHEIPLRAAMEAALAAYAEMQKAKA